MAETARRVDPGRKPETDRSRIDDGGVDVRDPHQRLQPRFLRSRERTQTGDRERAVLVDERDDVRDGRDGDEIEMSLQRRRLGAEQRLPELVHDAGSAEIRERIRRRTRRNKRTSRELVTRPMVVGHDDVEAAYPQRWIGKVEVRTTDGRKLTARVDVPKGDPGNPLTRAELEAKAVRLARFRGGASEAEMRAAIDRIWRFETEAQVQRLLA